MLSRTFHRRCLLCCQNLAKKCMVVSRGQNSALQRTLSPLSTTTEQRPQQEKMIQATPNRTLALCMSNTDVIPETLLALSENMIDAYIDLYKKNNSHDRIAYLVFGSEVTAKKEYKNFKTFGLDVRFLDEMNKILWLELHERKRSEKFVQSLSKNIENIEWNEESNQCFASVQFSSEEEALTVYRLLSWKAFNKKGRRVWAGRKECIISIVDKSRSLWVGHFQPEVTDEQIKNMACDPCNVIIKQADDGLRYAFMEFESESLAEKNYQFLKLHNIKAKMAKTCDNHTEQRSRSVTLFLNDMSVMEFAKLNLADLSEDAIDGHCVNIRVGVSRAYLMFESKQLAEKNSKLLERKGYITDPLKACINPKEEKISVECQKHIDSQGCSRMKYELDEAAKRDKKDKVIEKDVDKTLRTLYIPLGLKKQNRDDIAGISEEIMNVQVKSAKGLNYALVVFPTKASAQEHLKLFKSKGFNASFRKM